jgi:signal transduction histidine kinase
VKSSSAASVSGRYSRELNLLEQVHAALGSASKLDDFYVIVCSMLVDPNTFGFSRAFFLRWDERTRSYSGRIALGAMTREEHVAFQKGLFEETSRLKEQIDEIQQDTRDPVAVQQLLNLRYHSLWITLIQGREEGTAMNAGFQEIVLKRDQLSPEHLLERATVSQHPRLYGPDTVVCDGIAKYIQLPVIAGRLITKRGLNGIILADRMYEEESISDEALYYFHWLINHACVTLDNVELVEELTTTTQRLQEVDRLKTSFLSIVSHELRTPLTSIIGFSDLVAHEKVGPLSASQRDLLQRVWQHANHLQNMVNDLLEIAEVESGGMLNVNLGPVDPLAALVNTIPRIEARRAIKNIPIEPVIRDRVPLIRADQNLLERIYFHLLDNAVKFIPAKGRVTVEFVQQYDLLDIAIRDTGIGISQEHLKRIFDYFYQVDFRLERAFGGMGIGLTVVKLLLGAIGGQIRVESTPDVGSCFTLTFPVASTSGSGAGSQ